jgi:hypothetical protein
MERIIPKLQVKLQTVAVEATLTETGTIGPVITWRCKALYAMATSISYSLKNTLGYDWFVGAAISSP